ncbi:MAG: DUF2975 domain-containing protein [Oscillospiraceae bacterium]
MWNQKRSLALSKLFTLLFMAGLAAVLLFAPRLVKWLILFSINAKPGYFWFYLATIYTGGVFAAALLYNMYRLLHCIGLGQVFTNKNVAFLRHISWCCFIGAVICLVSGLGYYLPWLVVGVAAAFMGLVVRVVKNIVAQAIILKEENDFTI